MGSSRREPRRDLFDSPNKQRCVSRTSATRCHPSFGSSREMRTGLGVGVPLAHPRPRLALTPTPSLPSRRRTSEIASVIDHSNSPTFSKLLQRATPAVGDVETSRVGTGAKSASPFGASATRPTRATRDDAPPTSEFTLGHLTLASDPGDPPAGYPPPPGRASDDSDATRDAEPRLRPSARTDGRCARLPPATPPPRSRTPAAAWERRLAARGRASGRRARVAAVSAAAEEERLAATPPPANEKPPPPPPPQPPPTVAEADAIIAGKPRARGARGGATKGGSRARVPLRRRRQARIGGCVARARRRATRG